MLPSQMPAAAPEIVALGSAVVDLFAAIKNKDSAMQDVQVVLPDLIAALGGVANLGADIKSAANQAYLIWALAQCFEAP